MENLNPINYLYEKVTAHFLEQNFNKFHRKYVFLFKAHNDKLSANGDVSFQLNDSAWQNVAECSKENEFQRKLHNFITAPEAQQSFLNAANEWQYPVMELNIKNNRCSLHLNRCIVMETLLKRVLFAEENNDCYGKVRRYSRKLLLHKIQGDNVDVNDLSTYRAMIVNKVMSHLLDYVEWLPRERDEINGGESAHLQVVCMNQDYAPAEENIVQIKCGLVMDPTIGKLARMTVRDYLKLRSSQMCSIAMHKHGVRVKCDEQFRTFIDQLGSAAVTVDLLEVKHSSPVKLVYNGQGRTKGASFILYNSARLETLLRKFDELVKNSTYTRLPAIDTVRFDVLNKDEEWQLLFGYIFQFPNLIECCLEQMEQGVCPTHAIVHFLCNFVSAISVYYRRIRVLTERRAHLMPYIFARIYFIKATRHILNKALALLDIQPVVFM